VMEDVPMRSDSDGRFHACAAKRTQERSIGCQV
jgi:hypothetical protein